MPVTVQGVVIKSINISRDNEGQQKLEGNYQILSSNNTVLATNGFNGYNDVKVNFGTETLAALNNFLALVKKEVSLTVLGE